MSASDTNHDVELLLPGLRFHPTNKERLPARSFPSERQRRKFYIRRRQTLEKIKYKYKQQKMPTSRPDQVAEIIDSKSIVPRTGISPHYRGLLSENGGGGTSRLDSYQTWSSPVASFSSIQLTQLITTIEERRGMRHYSPSRDAIIRINVTGEGLVAGINQDDDSGHLSDYNYNDGASREDCKSSAQVRAAENFHIDEGEGMHQPTPMDVPQYVCIDIIEPDKTGTVYDFKMGKKGSVRIRVHRSGQVMREIILGITGQAAISPLGYGLINNSFSKPALSFVVGANAVGFIGTLTAISPRDKRREVAAGILAKVGAMTAAAAATVARGMYLPVDFFWTSGVACLIPAAAVAFA